MKTYTVEAHIKKGNYKIEVPTIIDKDVIQCLYDSEMMLFIKIKEICRNATFINKKEEKMGGTLELPRLFRLYFTENFEGVIKVYDTEVGYVIDTSAIIEFKSDFNRNNSSVINYTSLPTIKSSNTSPFLKISNSLPAWRGDSKYG